MLLPVISSIIILVAVRLSRFRSLASPTPPSPQPLLVLTNAVGLVRGTLHWPRVNKDLVDDLSNPVRPDIHGPAFDGDRIVKYGLAGVARALKGLPSAEQAIRSVPAHKAGCVAPGVGASTSPHGYRIGRMVDMRDAGLLRWHAGRKGEMQPGRGQAITGGFEGNYRCSEGQTDQG